MRFFLIISFIFIYNITKPNKYLETCLNRYEKTGSNLTPYDKALLCRFEANRLKYLEKGDIQKANQELQKAIEYQEHLKSPP